MDEPFRQESSTSINLKLPVRITDIKPQKKRKDRFSLFHENQFILGVSAELLNKFDLKKGVEITPFLFDQLRYEEQRQSAKDFIIRLLGRRDHSTFELKEKAVRKGFNPDHADHILTRLEERGYLDDKEFARKFVSDKVRLSKWGPLKIKTHLRKKGVNKRDIEYALSEHTDSLELKKICVDLIGKRKEHFCRVTDDFKRTQKIAAYLQRKGFTYDTINRAMPDIIDRLNV
jgi:regulatory protein